MDALQIVLQLVAGLGIYNVWLLRFSRKTPYRGGDACDMRSEFAHYGLPGWSVFVVGFAKLAAATGLLIGLAFPALVLPSALLLALLMLGALAMHLKVRDPWSKSLPALSLLVISLVIAMLAA